MKPCIVLSGVNLIDMGPLAVFREALNSLVHYCGGSHEIVALVHRKDLFDTDGVTYLEFPEIKSSWLRRLRFEYSGVRALSQRLQPSLWLAMHDMTPNIAAERQAVYCHNPTPFHKFRFSEARLDRTFGLHVLLYKFLYRVNIQRNFAVIVQQDWIRQEFKKWYKVKNVIVAHPAVDVSAISSSSPSFDANRPYRFIYPAFPRVFKNIELLLKAIQILEARNISGFELLLTVSKGQTKYGDLLFEEYSNLKSVRWLGSTARSEIYRRYEESDCLVFPSKLETWGMPLTEFKATAKPIMAADLPYARETVGSYDRVLFFSPDDAGALAEKMQVAITGGVSWKTAIANPIPAPFARDWDTLWPLLVQGSASPPA